MRDRRRRPWLPIVLWLVASLTLFACGQLVDRVEAPTPVRPSPPTEGGEAVTQATLPPTPTVVQIRPTNTPPPPPPTPTSLPTHTPAPENTETREEAVPAITDVMVEIPAGPFTLGNGDSDPNEAPAQEMDLPAFMLDAYEATNADFAAFVEATGYATYREEEGSPQNWRAAYTEGKDNHPVVFVTFEDAQSFCQWTGKRLPTEFEWEKAARGSEGFLYPWGNDYDPKLLNGKDSGLRGTTAVGSYPPNGYGLFDVAGNVKEWVDSPYVAYPGSNYQDSHYNPNYRSIRGGGWFDEAEYVLSTNRNGGDPKITANDDIGFRCAK
jgi:formylglycine-generating enzyme required for sulfatase activity